jgi:DNA-binding transcriptional LysR family regulator
MSSMTLQQLRVLVSVLEHRSFTRGAQALFMTQSAASQHIRSLEQALGTPLLERAGGDVAPTRAGEGLARYAREMLRLAAEAERFIAAYRDGEAGRLVLGASGSAVYLVPPLVSGFRTARAGAELSLHVAPRDELCEAVAGGAVDVGITGEAPGDRRLASQPLCPDRIVLVAAPSSTLLPAAALAPLPLERVAGHPLVALAGPSPSWQLVERAAARQGVTLRPALRLDGHEAIKKAVEAGLGAAFLSAWVVEREVALGTLRLVPLDAPPFVRTFHLVYRAARHPDPLRETFLQFAPGYLARHLPGIITAAPGPPAGARSQVA